MPHTPGPWKYNVTDAAIWPGPQAPRRAPVADVFTAVDPSNETSFETISSTPEEEANGHLIAAAPDLLAACMMVLVVFPCHGSPWFDDLKRAVAKAEGREI